MINRVARGTKLTVELLNRIIDEANLAERITTGPGLTISHGRGGTIVGSRPGGRLPAEPGILAHVINVGDEDIPAHGVAGIVGDFTTSGDDLLSSRVLRVRKPKACDAGSLVIAQDFIAKNGDGGRAWLTGVAVVRLMRWFRSDLLDTAECFAGESYAVATAGGSLDIIYEIRDDRGAPIIGTEHLAVVRFNHRRYTRWTNKGSTTVAMGDPITRTSSETDGTTDGLAAASVPRFNVLSMKSPVDQTPTGDAFINVGGDVAAGEDGVCSLASEPVMLRTSTTKDAGDLIGAVNGTNQFAAGSGFRVMAGLGTAASGSKYAVARTVPGSSPLLLMRILDGQTVYNVGGTTYYGIKVGSVVGGVGVAYDPNVSTTPGAFTAIDGIGRAYLYTNGVISATPVLVALDSTYPIPNALITGDYVQADGTVTIIVGGDPTNTISAYIPVFQ